MHVNTIIVAGGSGRRMGGELPKQFIALAGVPPIRRVTEKFCNLSGLDRLVIVARPGYWALCQELLADAIDVPLVFAAAGEERQDSVAAGVAMLAADCEIVLVHDAVRPFVTVSVIERCAAAAAEYGAALAAVPASDTVKEVSSHGQVKRTLDRAGIWLAQTPQAFQADILRQAHARARADGIRATDDAALVERLGVEVRVVEGEVTNIKITKPGDLPVAELIARLEGS